MPSFDYLSLDGTARHTKGILPLAARAREDGYQRVFVPAAEAALLPDIEVYPVRDLGQLVGHLTGLAAIEPVDGDVDPFGGDDVTYAADFADIMGQEHVRRAMEVAAAGGHNAFMFGTKTSGIFSLGAANVTDSPVTPGQAPPALTSCHRLPVRLSTSRTILPV